MFSNQPAELNLAVPLRTASAVRGDRRNHRFLVGTSVLPTGRGSSGDNASSSGGGGGGGGGGGNQLHLLRFHEEANELGVDGVIDHPTGEVWCQSPCPSDRNLVITCGGGGAGSAATTKLWRIPGEVMEREDDLDYGEVDDMGGVGGGSGMGSELADALGEGAGGAGAAVRSLPVATSGADTVEMDPLATLFVESDDVLGGRVSCALWHPSSYEHDDFGGAGGGGGGVGMSTARDLITVGWHDGVLTRWDLTSDAIEVGRIDLNSGISGSFNGGGKRSRKGLLTPHRAAWDPHNPNLVGVTTSTGIAIHDLRNNGAGNSAVHLDYDHDAGHGSHGSGLSGGGHIGTGSGDDAYLGPCHRYGVTDLDYNPNKPNVVVTSGQDGLVKFWDVRTASSSSSSSNSSYSRSLGGRSRGGGGSAKRPQPLRILRGGHVHWSTKVSYNAFHDQLVLSAGSDSVVNLWRVSSISSAPLLDLDGGNDSIVGLSKSFDDLDVGVAGDDDDGGAAAADDNPAMGSNDATKGNSRAKTPGEDGSGADVRVSTFESPDSVYDVAWSAADAWSFLVVGYDGTVSLNHVPSKEKYKILL